MAIQIAVSIPSKLNSHSCYHLPLLPVIVIKDDDTFAGLPNNSASHRNHHHAKDKDDSTSPQQQQGRLGLCQHHHHKPSWRGHFLIRMFFMAMFVFAGIMINAVQFALFITIRVYSVRLYRKINYYLIYTSWSQVVGLAEWWSGLRFRLYYPEGDDVDAFAKKHTFVTMNHRYELDWLICWMISDKYKVLGSSKSFAKKSLRFAPVVGWAWFLSDFIFLERSWEKDKDNIVRGLDQLMQYDDPILLLFFPEGTRFTPDKYKTSMEFAKEKGLKQYRHHLLPRVRGFACSVRHLKKNYPDAEFYDLQLAFRENESNTFGGVLRAQPATADIYLRRIPVEKIPSGSEEEVADFLYKLFEEKDDLMEYHKQNQRFPGRMIECQPRLGTLFNFVAWTLIIILISAKFLMMVLTSGNYLLITGTVVLITLTFAAVNALIGSTKMSKASSYGVKNKKNN